MVSQAHRIEKHILNGSPLQLPVLSCPLYRVCNICSSVTQSCPTLCNPVDCSTPGFSVLPHLLEFAQTHVHWVGDAIQPSHPLSSPSPPASVFPSITAFSSESVLCFRWPKYWSFSFSISPSNEHSGLISFRIDLLDLLTVQETPKSSPAPQFLCINFLVLSLFYCPALMSIHNYCKNHSFDYMDLCRQSSTIYFQIIFLEWRWSLKNWTWPSDTTSHFSVLMSQNSRKTMHVHTGLCNVHIRNYFMVFMNTINKNSPSLLKWVLWKSN